MHDEKPTPQNAYVCEFLREEEYRSVEGLRVADHVKMLIEKLECHVPTVYLRCKAHGVLVNTVVLAQNGNVVGHNRDPG